MDIQYILVGLILVFALGYVGTIVWRKIKAFSPKSTDCGTDCGCDAKTKS